MTKQMTIMTDQGALGGFVRQGTPKQISKGSIRTQGRAVKRHFLDITAMIRSIQRAEGNPACFRTGRASCDQCDCAWIEYCLEGHKTTE